MSVRVLVVDDQDVVRHAAAELLADDPSIDVIGQACNGVEAVEMSAALTPDVIVMDMRMPLMDGVEATRRIAVVQPETHVLVHSAYGDESLVIEAFQAGARGYVLKGSAASDLLEGGPERRRRARPRLGRGRSAADHEIDPGARPGTADACRGGGGRCADARVTAQQQEFAIQAAHELRTPLTTLMGALELLADLEDVTAESVERSRRPRSRRLVASPGSPTISRSSRPATTCRSRSRRRTSRM